MVLKVNTALQWSPCTFAKLQMSPPSSTSSPPLLCPALVIPLPSPTVSRAPATPRRLSSRHVPPQHCARHSPPRAAPLPASPHRAAIARASTRAAGLPAAVPARPCLLLDLKHIPELSTNSLLPSRTHISVAFLLPEHYTSPEPHLCLGSPLTAASAASHPRFSALTAPPQPTEAHKPAKFRSPALDRPDHRAGELELPTPLHLAVVRTIHRLLAPAKHTISTTSP
jgi:hypothetical protein